MEKEMNFFDLCIAIVRYCFKGIKAIVCAVGYLIRLTWRKMYIVLPVALLVCAAVLYWARPSHRNYDVETVVILNGPSYTDFSQVYMYMINSLTYSDTQNMSLLLNMDKGDCAKLYDFELHGVIDCFDDGTPDYIDYKDRASRVDTLAVFMDNYACICFSLHHNPSLLPRLEESMLNYFNSVPVMQAKYKAYLKDLQQESEYCHSQMTKLDSLTTKYYFEQNIGNVQNDLSGVNFVAGDRRIMLFLNEIQKHIKYTREVDQKLACATAPVVFTQHLIAREKGIYRKVVLALIAVLLGWCSGCALAALVEEWKPLMSWLKSK